MSGRISGVAGLLLLAACVTTPAVPPAVTGYFVSTLGTDTVAVERYTRTPERLEGEILRATPVPTSLRYVAELNPSGTIRAMTITSRRLDADTAGPAASVVTIALRDTLADVSVVRSGARDTVQSGQKVFHGSAIVGLPGFPSSAALYEHVLAATQLPATDSVRYLLMAPGRNAPNSLWLARRGDGRVAFTNTWTPGWTEFATVDPSGRIMNVNSTATTVKTVTQRVSSLDFQGLRARWAAARGTPTQLSPPDTLRTTLGNAAIEITYGRPYKRGRVIFGGDVVPWNQVWRTGANAATHFSTTADLMIGGTHVPAGKYTLWTLPTPSGTQLIINRETGQWGTQYTPARDLARVNVTTRTLPQAVEQFTISVVPQGAGGALRLAWDTTEWSVPVVIH